MKKLAICIPTYNRSLLLDRLLNSIPSITDIMISICDDGSNDSTHDIVQNHEARLSIKYDYQENKGRASALRKSVLNSNAEYVMIVDSDDLFEKKGVEIILDSLKKNKGINFFVFPIKILKNSTYHLVSLKGIPFVNYLSIRSDYKIKHDLQEVISRKLLLNVMYDEPKNIRRIPTSFLWFKASEKTNCLPVNSLPVKIKEYLNDGMSFNLLPLKVNNAEYLTYTYKIALDSNKYSSVLYRFKYLILFYRYSSHNKSLKLLKLIDIPFFLIGYIYSIFDFMMLFVKK